MSVVIYRGNPFKARMGTDKFRAFAEVVYDAGSWRIQVFEEELWTHLASFELPDDPDLIAAWRAVQLFGITRVISSARLPINEQLIASAYFAAMRFIPHQEVARASKSMILVGELWHGEIMADRIPTTIVQAILEHQRDENPPNLSVITHEVRAGTVEWIPEFATAGVEHPDIVYPRNAELVRLLESYAPATQLMYGETWIQAVAQMLPAVIKLLVRKQIPLDVIVAVTGISVVVTMAQGAERILLTVDKNPGEEALARSAKWLAAQNEGMTFDTAKTVIKNVLWTGSN